MKKFLAILLILSTYLQAQTVHQLTGKELICMNKKNTKGFILLINIENQFRTCDNSIIQVGSINLGSCTEKSELILTFKDGTGLSICSQNRFNCSGLSTFILCPYALEKLSTVGVKKIKYKNRYSHRSYSKKMEDPDFFIDLIYGSLGLL